MKRRHTNRRKAKPFKRFAIAPCSNQNSTSLFATVILKYDMIYDIYLAAIGLTPGGSGTAHIYTQTVHRIQRTEHT